jgi:hypothetical protein
MPQPLRTDIFHASSCLLLALKSLGEPLHVPGKRTVVREELNVGTVDLDAAGLALLDVLLAAKWSEAPVLGDDDLLATRELVLAAAEGLDGGGTVWSVTLAIFAFTSLRRGRGKHTAILCPNGENDLTNVHTGDGAVGLAPSTTHTSLQSIGTGT